MTDQAMRLDHQPMFSAEFLRLTLGRLGEATPPHRVTRSTQREVEAIEYLDGGVPTYLELGSLEQHAGRMWLVCGIFEPEDADAPWVVAHVARHEGSIVLRRPFVVIDQAAVTRVYDGFDGR